MTCTWLTMNRSFPILIFVTILLAGCIAGGPAENGTLQLTSSPAGAEIYFDSQYWGTTPGSVSVIVPGNHTLEFRLKGYTGWKSVITVPSGTSNYGVALAAEPASQKTVNPTSTGATPARVTVRADSNPLIVGDSNTFSGSATGTRSVALTLFGPGYYADGIQLDTVNPNSAGLWSYTWSPGTKIQSGAYTLIVYDAGKTTSGEVKFTVIGNGEVTVFPNSYALARGDTLILSGMCTTGAPSVRITLFGPGRYTSGVLLATLSVTSEKTWSFRYPVDETMPTGTYTVSVSDVPKTDTGTSQLTIGYT